MSDPRRYQRSVRVIENHAERDALDDEIQGSDDLEQEVAERERDEWEGLSEEY